MATPSVRSLPFRKEAPATFGPAPRIESKAIALAPRSCSAMTSFASVERDHGHWPTRFRLWSSMSITRTSGWVPFPRFGALQRVEHGKLHPFERIGRNSTRPRAPTPWRKAERREHPATQTSFLRTPYPNRLLRCLGIVSLNHWRPVNALDCIKPADRVARRSVNPKTPPSV